MAFFTAVFFVAAFLADFFAAFLATTGALAMPVLTASLPSVDPIACAAVVSASGVVCFVAIRVVSSPAVAEDCI